MSLDLLANIQALTIAHLAKVECPVSRLLNAKITPIKETGGYRLKR
ncbi:hypothetical protein SFMTTN_2431 [Sulfuriferula multivorans]|uniref:Uncharacterized protein n=1 Tax=Sulfuriferula multivorans TaxID=1559896 RepID=A0A401JG66_9PROT|nr:hypothetical protein [Sulfuriferula multivorans]GBL46616.1 hypothetical protein SFMTTN_2431 [Sulfuriferula multivorans]